MTRHTGTRSLTIATGALTRRRREELNTALGWLTYNALTAEVERARNKPVESLDVRDLSFRAYVDWGGKKWLHRPVQLAALVKLHGCMRERDHLIANSGGTNSDAGFTGQYSA